MALTLLKYIQIFTIFHHVFSPPFLSWHILYELSAEKLVILIKGFVPVCLFGLMLAIHTHTPTNTHIHTLIKHTYTHTRARIVHKKTSLST